MKHIFIPILILALVAALTSPDATYAQDKATETDLEALGTKLKAAIASGEMTEEAAAAEYEKAVGKIKGKDEKNWKAPTINGLPCSPNVPDGVDPTDSVSFDPNHIVCIKVTMDPHDFERLRRKPALIALEMTSIKYGRIVPNPGPQRITGIGQISRSTA